MFFGALRYGREKEHARTQTIEHWFQRTSLSLSISLYLVKVLVETIGALKTLCKMITVSNNEDGKSVSSCTCHTVSKSFSLGVSTLSLAHRFPRSHCFVGSLRTSESCCTLPTFNFQPDLLVSSSASCLFVPAYMNVGCRACSRACRACSSQTRICSRWLVINAYFASLSRRRMCTCTPTS